MRSRPSTLRAAALLAGAALALHQLRYLIGYSPHSGHALAHQGHGYLEYALPLVAALLVLAGGALLARVARAWHTGVPEAAPPRFAWSWAAAAVALIVIYAGQELLESVLTAGHPGGVAALSGHGGLVALPLAVLLGGLVALLLRGAGVAVARAARRARRARLPRAPHRARRPGLVGERPYASVLARHLAGRAPPHAA
jgi:hypothetical protein